MYVLTHTIQRYGSATRTESYETFTDLSRRAFALGVIQFTMRGDISRGAIYDGSKIVAKYELGEVG